MVHYFTTTSKGGTPNPSILWNWRLIARSVLIIKPNINFHGHGLKKTFTKSYRCCFFWKHWFSYLDRSKKWSLNDFLFPDTSALSALVLFSASSSSCKWFKNSVRFIFKWIVLRTTCREWVMGDREANTISIFPQTIGNARIHDRHTISCKI